MEDRSDAALVALRKILRAIEINSRGLAREAGLTPSQLIILQLIDKIDNATPSLIAKQASITQATVTVLIDKLERQGFVTRQRDTTDRRRVLVEVSAKGKSTLAGAPDILQERFRNRFEGLALWEQSALVSTLERVAAILDAEDIDAAPVLDVGAIDKPLAES
ncbi:MAG: MarR family winged helix-turn-helix transcriptional regulator [Parvularculaceae bacterium]